MTHSTPIAEMLASDCPSYNLLHRIGARWTIFVMSALNEGPMRFTALRQHIRGITPKVLAETLRTLEYDGLITRTVLETAPPGTEYSLTELGRSLYGVLGGVCQWAAENVDEILAAQEQHDRAAADADSIDRRIG